MPSARSSRLSSPRSRSRNAASSAVRGSSSSRMPGRIATARASATRWRWPPESWSMRRFSSPVMLVSAHQFGDARGALLAGHAPDLQAVADIVGDAHVGEQRVGLEHHADIALLDRHRRHVLAVEQHPAAGIRQFEAGDDAQHRGLAAAGGAEQHQRFAARDVERGGLERAGAVGKGLAASLDAHRGAMPAGTFISPAPCRQTSASRPAAE